MKGNVNLANCINTHVIAYRLMGITFIILSLGFLIPITQLDYPVHFIIWVSFCELFSLSFFMYFTFYKRNVLKYCLIKNDNIEIYEKKTNKKVIILNKNDVYFAKYIDIWRIKIIINNNYLIVDRDFPEKIGINITYNRQCAKPKSWTDCKGEKKVGNKKKNIDIALALKIMK